MKEHFSEMIEAPIIPPMPNMAVRLKSASDEWHELEKQLASFSTRRSPMNAALLFGNLSGFVRTLIDDVQLQSRLIQHFEVQIKREFPAEPGKLFSA